MGWLAAWALLVAADRIEDAPRQTASALLVGSLVATHELPADKAGSSCQLDVEVGAGAPVPVAVDEVEAPGACGHKPGARLRVKARIVAAYYRDIAPRFWLEAVEVKAR